MEQPSTLKSLAARLGMDRYPVSRYCKELERLGWMQIASKGNNRRPVAMVPKEVEAKIAAETRKRIELKPYQGEATSQAFVAWILAPAVQVLFNVRPPILYNKATGQNLELDVWVPDHAWAKEYQGDQHFGPTDQYKGNQEFIERYRRDRLKAELCKQHGIRLSHITKHDLTLKKMIEAIPDDIPHRTFDPNGPYIKMLEQLGRKVAEGRDWDRQ
jgi:DNA-binding MarR family transcriptional regulator